MRLHFSIRGRRSVSVQSRMLATKDVAEFTELGAGEVAYLRVFDGGGLKVRGT